MLFNKLQIENDGKGYVKKYKSGNTCFSTGISFDCFGSYGKIVRISDKKAVLT